VLTTSGTYPWSRYVTQMSYYVCVCVGSVKFSKHTSKKTSMLRFQLFIVNLFAKSIVLEGDTNIVPPLCKVERGIRPLSLTLTPLHPIHVIYMPCVILCHIKRFWLSCLIGPFCFSYSKIFLSCLTFRSVDFERT